MNVTDYRAEHHKKNSHAYQMDCMRFMQQFPDGFFNLAITDPPYGIGVTRMAFTKNPGDICVQKNGTKLRVKSRLYFSNEWDCKCPDESYFKELFRVSRSQIIFGVNYISFLLPGSGRIVWDKCNGNSSFSDAEIAYCSLHNRVRLYRYMWNGMCQGKNSYEGNVQKGNKKFNEKRIHVCQKPIALYLWILRNYAQENDLILDTHLGSQSSRIAAWNGKFEFYGTEIDPVYFQNGCKRFDTETQQLSLF